MASHSTYILPTAKALPQTTNTRNYFKLHSVEQMTLCGQMRI